MTDLMQAIRRKALILTVGTCSCNTKTPDIRYHKNDCRYRIAAEIVLLTEEKDDGSDR